MAGDIYALSVRQPWPFAMEHFGKDVENRSRKTNIRGRILIHASRHKVDFIDHRDLKRMMKRAVTAGALTLETLERFVKNARLVIPPMWSGGFVGSVEIVDCVRDHKSPWYIQDSWAYVLRDYRPLKGGFVPAVGRQGFWKVPGGEALAA